jgi:hypothetical protein
MGKLGIFSLSTLVALGLALPGRALGQQKSLKEGSLAPGPRFPSMSPFRTVRSALSTVRIREAS